MFAGMGQHTPAHFLSIMRQHFEGTALFWVRQRGSAHGLSLGWVFELVIVYIRAILRLGLAG